ncbi:methyltransferase family protein [Candidatus Omnitrophota bacterium]
MTKITVVSGYAIAGLTYILFSSSMLLFVVFLYYDSLGLVQIPLGETSTLIWDTCLCCAFFIQHSGMIRRSFRSWVVRFVPLYFQPVLYTVVSSSVLMILVVFWQETDRTVVSFVGIPGVVLRCVFFTACGIILWGVMSLKGDLAGTAKLLAHIGGIRLKPMDFTVKGPYRWVRHPLYMSVIMMIWSSLVWTSDRLLFNVFWTVWIIIGTLLEERDLASDFGDDYREYQRKVPMLLPYRFRQMKED